MTYQSNDLSTDSGAPIELYEFTVPGSSLAWRLTNAPAAEGDYLPAPISHGDISQSAGNVGATTSIEVADQNPVAVAMLAGLSSRPVQVVIREKHRGDTDSEEQQVFVGLVTGVSFAGAKATLTCGSRYALVSKRRVPWLTFQAGCNWEWGGVGCGVNRNTYRVTLSLTSASQSERTLTASAAASQDDGYYSGGWVERASTGETRFVEEHAGDQLLLALPWAELSATAEDYYLFPGCQKTEAYCASAFSNLDNYLGWPRLPSINPFNRSAYYQTGVPDVPDPGDTDDTGTGYSLVLSNQTINVEFGIGSELAYNYPIEMGVTFEPSGILTCWVNGVGYALSAVYGSGVATGGAWINPKPPVGDRAWLTGYEVSVLTPTLGYGSITAVDNIGTWMPADETATFSATQNATSSPVTMTFPCRVRDAGTGLVRVGADVTIRATFFQGVSEGGA